MSNYKITPLHGKAPPAILLGTTYELACEYAELHAWFWGAPVSVHEFTNGGWKPRAVIEPAPDHALPERHTA